MTLIAPRGMESTTTPMTQCRQIPPFTIALVSVQMMHRQHSLFAVSLVLAVLIALGRLPRFFLPMTTAHTTPAGALFHCIGNLPPVLRIINHFHVSLTAGVTRPLQG